MLCARGVTWGKFGTGVRPSILKPTPIIYLAFENYDLFIYLIVHNAEIFICCPLILYSSALSVCYLQSKSTHK